MTITETLAIYTSQMRMFTYEEADIDLKTCVEHYLGQYPFLFLVRGYELETYPLPP